MIPAQELLLVLAAFGLYAADASRLLWADELVLEKRGTRWVARDGAPFLIAGRRPMVPSLLRPANPLLLVSVDRLTGEVPEPAHHGCRYLDALRPLGWRATALFLLFFPGLPLVLGGFGSGVELLAWLLAVYATVGSIGWHAWRRRSALGLRRRTWLVLLLEGVLCPPLAINIVRKLALRADLVRLESARQLLGPEGHARLVGAANRRIDEMLAYAGPDEPLALRLAAQRLRLQAQAQA